MRNQIGRNRIEDLHKIGIGFSRSKQAGWPVKTAAGEGGVGIGEIEQADRGVA